MTKFKCLLTLLRKGEDICLTNIQQAETLKSCEMKEELMKNDEGWMKNYKGWMKKGEGWMKNDKWWFQADEGFCNELTM